MGDSVSQQFVRTTSLASAKVNDFFNNSRRFFVGAERQDYEGTVFFNSDVVICSQEDSRQHDEL